MSTIWTPSGEYVPKPEPEPEQVGPVGPQRPPTEDEARAAMEQARAMLTVPVVEHVGGHLMALFELAALHLQRQAITGEAPDLAEASLAIDAMAAVVETLGERLGQYQQPLREAVSDLQAAFVQVS